MKTWKLVSGIISIIISVVIYHQSNQFSALETFSGAKSSISMYGYVAAMLILSSGIVSISTRESEKNGGNYAMIIMFLIAAYIGFSIRNVYQDMLLWAGWSIICIITTIAACGPKPSKK